MSEPFLFTPGTLSSYSRNPSSPQSEPFTCRARTHHNYNRTPLSLHPGSFSSTFRNPARLLCNRNPSCMQTEPTPPRIRNLQHVHPNKFTSATGTVNLYILDPLPVHPELFALNTGPLQQQNWSPSPLYGPNPSTPRSRPSTFTIGILHPYSWSNSPFSIAEYVRHTSRTVRFYKARTLHGHSWIPSLLYPESSTLTPGALHL